MSYPPQQGPPTAYMPPPPEPKKGKKAAGCLGIGCGGLVLIGIVAGIAVAVGGSKSTNNPSTVAAPVAATASSPAAVAKTSPPKAAVPAKPAPKPKADTVTYIVTGTRGADIQYGTAGSNAQGHVPMKITKTLGHPLYYSISAQLQGYGKVTCKIEINGKTISTATASGGYNIAMCEMSQDPLTGDWVDTNGG